MDETTITCPECGMSVRLELRSARVAREELLDDWVVTCRSMNDVSEPSRCPHMKDAIAAKLENRPQAS